MPLRRYSLLAANLVVIGFCCTALLFAFATRRAAGQAAKTGDSPSATPVLVKGDGFTVAPLQQNALAFNNRSYRWLTVPPGFVDWQYTRTSGGETAHLTVTTAQAGTVWVASGATTLPGGWEPQTRTVLAYSDKAHSVLHLFRRQFSAGETIAVPQGGWTGTLVLSPLITGGPPPAPPATAQNVPGVVVEYLPVESGQYVGSPALAVLPDGTYVAAHDFFGPKTRGDAMRVFQSHDRGQTWQAVSDITGQYWSSLFVHNGALYLMGTSKGFGIIVVRRSDDDGKTWTTPRTPQTGLIVTSGRFHCAPVPVVVWHDRIWRAMEDIPSGAKGRDFRAYMLSAPVSADLLRADSWTMTNRLPDPKPGLGMIWLEGNAVVLPPGEGGGMGDLIRVDPEGRDKAALLRVSPDHKTITFDPQKDTLDFPGGGTKFTVRYDAPSGRYWSLTNPQTNPTAQRNRLALVSSPDLRHWTIEAILLEHPDRQNIAFQYVDWLTDGDDMIFVSRTAWNGAHSYHDANYLTFHRLLRFRDKATRKLQ